MDPRYRVSRKQWKNVGGRETIVNSKGETFQWDSKKGEVEVYRGNNHKGGYDPYNRERQISREVAGRTPNGANRTPKSTFFDKIKGFKLPNITMPLFNEMWLRMSTLSNNSMYYTPSGTY